MPSPIAHLGVGYAVYHYYKTRLPQDQRGFWKISLQVIMVAGLSMLPDLDVIPAIIFGDMKAYHNNFSHSLFFAVPVAFLVAGIFHRIYRSNFWLWFVICLISYDLHVIMDALTAERGVMMFWPFTQARFASPIKIFYGLQWGLGWFSPWHLWTVFTESLFVLVVTLAVNFFRKRRERTENHRSQEI
jgi:membrane-bound metal-dependent hydrolase YbcI (DUF457 family)